MKHLIRPAAWTATFLACAFATAAAPTTRPGLHLSTPAGWTQSQEPSPDGKKAGAILITAPAAVHLRIRIQPVPLGDKVLSDDVLKQLVANMVKPELAGQPMPEAQKVEGSASGYKVTFKPPKQGAKGEAVEVTDVVVQMPGLALAAGITTREKSEWLDDAVKILTTATFGRPASATR